MRRDRKSAWLAAFVALTAPGCTALTNFDRPFQSDSDGGLAIDAQMPSDAARSDAALDAEAPMDAWVPPADAGADAGTDAEAPIDAGTDAGAPIDAGTDAGAPIDAGTDAGAPTDAGAATDGGCAGAVDQQSTRLAFGWSIAPGDWQGVVVGQSGQLVSLDVEQTAVRTIDTTIIVHAGEGLAGAVLGMATTTFRAAGTQTVAFSPSIAVTAGEIITFEIQYDPAMTDFFGLLGGTYDPAHAGIASSGSPDADIWFRTWVACGP